MKFWGILFGILGGLGLLGFLVLANLHSGESLTASQKQKALTNLLGRAPVITPVDRTQWQTYSGQYVSFSYPSWATVYTQDNENAKKDTHILDSFHFGLSDEHMTGIVTVLNRSAFSQVSDDPGVQLRLQSADYERSASTSSEMDFMNQVTMERSAFILKNGKLYTLVITGGGDNDNRMIFQRIKDSLQVVSKPLE